MKAVLVNRWELALRHCVPTGVRDAKRRREDLALAGLTIPVKGAFGERGRQVDYSKLGTLPKGALAGERFTVVDVGAHVGAWARAVKALKPSAVLHLIEPTPASIGTLRQAFAGTPDVNIHPVAVGDHAGTVQLRTFSSSDFNSLLPLQNDIRGHYHATTEEQTLDVELTTLDQLLTDIRTVDLLKIDVQGAEAAVLRGAADVLGRTRHLMIEMNMVSHYAGDTLFWDLHPGLTDAGFEFYRFGFEYHDAERRLLWADAIYRR
jgi:FkbM family methyltransferase